MYYVYILRCLDESLYCGITTDMKRRYQEHLSKGKKSARYTKVHGVKSLEALWQCENRSLALKLEYSLKKLNKKEKEDIVLDNFYFHKYLNTRVHVDLYERLEKIQKIIDNRE